MIACFDWKVFRPLGRGMRIGEQDLAAGRRLCMCERCRVGGSCQVASGLGRIHKAFRLANGPPPYDGLRGRLWRLWWTERCMNCLRRVPKVGKVWGRPTRKRLRAICDRCLPLAMFDADRADWVGEPWIEE